MLKLLFSLGQRRDTQASIECDMTRVASIQAASGQPDWSFRNCPIIWGGTVAVKENKGQHHSKEITHLRQNVVYYSYRRVEMRCARGLCHQDAMRVSTWEGFLSITEVADGHIGGGAGVRAAGAHTRLLTETADWAMLHNTSRTSKRHGTYLALAAHRKTVV